MADPSAGEIIEELHKALTAAQGHLEYCNYGDSWERECAVEENLASTMTVALSKSAKYLGVEE